MHKRQEAIAELGSYIILSRNGRWSFYFTNIYPQLDAHPIEWEDGPGALIPDNYYRILDIYSGEAVCYLGVTAQGYLAFSFP